MSKQLSLDVKSLFLNAFTENYLVKLSWKISEWSVLCKDSTSFLLGSFRMNHECQFSWQLKFEAVGGKWETNRVNLELQLLGFGSSGMDTVGAKVYFCICPFNKSISCGFCSTTSPMECKENEQFNFTSIARAFKSELGFIFRNYKDLPELTIHCQIYYPKATPPSPALSTELGRILSDMTFSDITVLASGDTKLSAHRAILAARSPVFKAMFQTKMKERKKNQVDLSIFPPPVVKGMLQYCYTDKTVITLQHVRDWLRIADMYELQGLKLIVENTAVSNLKVDNAAELFQLSVLYKSARLKAKVTEFMKQNGKAISATRGFAEFVKENPFAVVELFSAVCN